MYRSATAVFLLCTLFFFSCKKEGCTDEEARNFDNQAKKDCGCCEYEGQVVFWWNKNTSEMFVDAGSKTLSISVTGYSGEALIGSASTTTFWASAPACGSSGAVTSAIPLGKKKSEVFAYSVKDETEFLYAIGVVTLSASHCEPVELKW